MSSVLSADAAGWLPQVCLLGCEHHPPGPLDVLELMDEAALADRFEMILKT